MPTHPQTVPDSGSNPPPGLSSAAVDASCRWPVLILFSVATLWLALGGLLGLIASIKAHAPGFMAAPGWLTYGRVRPASSNAIVYGFILQAGLGVTLWMVCRLGRTLLQGGWMILAAAGFFNLGLTIGIVWILAGGSTSYEWLELPGAVTPILFSAYVLIAAWAISNLHQRERRLLYVSQWFLLTSLFWFPWVYSTAQVLLVHFPGRGVTQAVVSGWYAHNLFELCLSGFGLAIIFYFLPKLLRRPLHSGSLALLLLVLECSLPAGRRSGRRTGAKLAEQRGGSRPRLPDFAPFGVRDDWYRTWASGRGESKGDVVLRFILVAAGSYLLAAALETIAIQPPINRTVVFTLFYQGLAQLKIHGFLAISLAGAIYFIGPRIAGRDWAWPRFIPLHFWTAVAGMALTATGLVIGGVVQGVGINHPETEFIKVVRSCLPFLGLSTLGATLLLVSYTVFCLQLWRLVSLACACCCRVGHADSVRLAAGTKEGARL
ncbi:MAG: cbb3-type cytochrome c oxidase subunit I [Verrucomicrobiota bacterium]